MIQFKGDDGSTKDQAIIILGAKSDFEGVDAEYRYLDKNYPDWEFDEQTLFFEKDMQYDLMAIELPDGSKKDIWFDISDFYAKEDD